MDEDTVDSTEPTIDSQTLPAVSHTQKIAALSNASVTTTKTPHIETIRTATAMHLSMPSDLASLEDAQNSQNITTNLDDTNDKPADIHDARLLNVTPGKYLFFGLNLYFSFLSFLFHGAAMSYNEL